MPHPPVGAELHHCRGHRHLLGVLCEVEHRVVPHEEHHEDQHPYPQIGPTPRNQVQFRPLVCREPVPDHHEGGESDLEVRRHADIPLGIVNAGVQVAVEAPANGGLEEEEVVVDEEEGEGPTFEEAIKVRRGDESEPCGGGGDNGELVEGGGGAEGAPAEGEEADGGEGEGEDPWPEDPGEAEVGPEEGAEEEGDGALNGEEGEGEEKGALEDGERGGDGE